jgi:hypothetical protein
LRASVDHPQEGASNLGRGDRPGRVGGIAIVELEGAYWAASIIGLVEACVGAAGPAIRAALASANLDRVR